MSEIDSKNQTRNLPQHPANTKPIKSKINPKPMSKNILEHYGAEDIEVFIKHFYMELQMSGSEISEMIEKDLRIIISPRTFQRWAHYYKLSRSQRHSLSVARDKQRIPYNSKDKSGYKKREINYSNFQNKRSETMRRNIPLLGLFAFGLGAILKNKNKRPEDLTSYLVNNNLRVQNTTVEQWACLHNRCNYVYIDTILKFFECQFEDIFNIEKADPIQFKNLRNYGIDFNKSYRSTYEKVRTMRNSISELNQFVRLHGSISQAAIKYPARITFRQLQNLLFNYNKDCEYDPKLLRQKLNLHISDEQVEEIIRLKEYYDLHKNIEKVVEILSPKEPYISKQYIKEKFLIGIEFGLISLS